MVLPSGMNSATDLLDQDEAKGGLASLGQILIDLTSYNLPPIDGHMHIKINNVSVFTICGMNSARDLLDQEKAKGCLAPR